MGFSWLLNKTYSKIRNIVLDPLSWFLVLFGAVLPDMDYLMEWILKTDAHRFFTHSLLFLPTVFILSIFTFKFCANKNFIKKEKILEYSTLLTLAVISHLLLDALLSPVGGIPIFWPFNTDYYGFRTGIVTRAELLTYNFSDPIYLLSKVHLAIADIALGTFALMYLIYSKRLKRL